MKAAPKPETVVLRIRDAAGSQVRELRGNDRFEIGAGWYTLRNLLLKGSYVQQNYRDFPTADIRNGGKFSGIMIEGVLAF